MAQQVQYVLGKNCRFYSGTSSADATIQNRVIEADVSVSMDTVDASDRGSTLLSVDVPVKKTGTVSVKIRLDTADHTFADALVAAIEGGTTIWCNPTTPVNELPGYYCVTSLTTNLNLNDVSTLDAELSMVEYCPTETNLPYTNED